MIMTLKEANGYSREEAYATTGFSADFEMLKNATQAWKKVGSPIDKKKLTQFLTDYATKQKLLGAYIVVDPSSTDTRERPYTIVNEVTDGKRKFKRCYAVVEAELKVTSSVTTDEAGEEKKTHTVKVINTGAVMGKADKKDEAFQIMRDLIRDTKKNFVVKIQEEVVEGKEYAGYGVYTPAKSAKSGKFIFGVTNE
jgi:hypothetical protein